jgi:hypothetical protein
VDAIQLGFSYDKLENRMGERTKDALRVTVPRTLFCEILERINRIAMVALPPGVR